jgi:poly(A) polymerase
VTADQDPKLKLSQAREFAVDIVRRLRQAGFQALWAGGCVRDQLLGLPPKDYDVATDAKPEQVQHLFGRRRTLAVGQSFGVIVVLGPKSAGQVDVATFRQDAAYSDGRHPDSVTFSSAPEDAQRRDFTINGLFYDPIAQQVIDYVGGQQDLQRRLIRAIGDPFQRFAEDKLRMLRAVRFATVFGFQIETGTLDAIRQLSRGLVVVSAERIAAELRQILRAAGRRRGIELLDQSGLLAMIFPELDRLAHGEQGEGPSPVWEDTLQILQRLDTPSATTALAALLRGLAVGTPHGQEIVRQIGQRLRLSNRENAETAFLIAHEPDVRAARQMPWPQLQRILIQPLSPTLLAYGQAVAEVLDGTVEEIEFCRQKLALPEAQRNPPPLITGDDLRAAGLPPGPVYRQILDSLRDAQLERRIHSRDQALEFAQQWLARRGTGAESGAGPQQPCQAARKNE